MAVVLLLTQVAVAAMQALRLASFTSRPTLRGIQTMTMLAPYLTNSGRFLSVYTATLASWIQLHRCESAPYAKIYGGGYCTWTKNIP